MNNKWVEVMHCSAGGPLVLNREVLEDLLKQYAHVDWYNVKLKLSRIKRDDRGEYSKEDIKDGITEFTVKINTDGIVPNTMYVDEIMIPDDQLANPDEAEKGKEISEEDITN